MDEIGTELGPKVPTTGVIVLGPSSNKETKKKTSENREWVTAIECISACGAHLKPLIIFKGQDVPNGCPKVRMIGIIPPPIQAERLTILGEAG